MSGNEVQPEVQLPVGTLCLIDSQAVYFQLRERFGKTSRCDYRKLRELIDRVTVGSDPDPVHCFVDAAVFVVAYQSFNVTGFVSMLRRFNFTVNRKDVATFETSGQGVNTKDNSCSTEIIAEAIRKADRYQRFIFGSGDGSLLPAVRALKEKGKEVWALTLPEALNSTMASEVDRVIALDESIVWAGSND
jgi:uncharacterized LabA/DUF88 family protein